MSKLYPVGVQNFEKVISGGYEYIDKTALIYQLFKSQVSFITNIEIIV